MDSNENTTCAEHIRTHYFLMALTTKDQACITVDKKIMKEGKKLAKLDRRSFSSYVEHLIAKDIQRHEKLQARKSAAD